MAVPNTTTFELQDVVDEVNPTTDDLVDCFADADASKFDAAYQGSKDELLNFRNYGAVCVAGLKTIAFYPTATTSGNACSPVGGEQDRYHNGAAVDPANGDKLYEDGGGCNVMNGGGSWFAMRNGGNFWKCTVSSTGIVGSKTACP